jgi:hypothetical protein
MADQRKAKVQVVFLSSGLPVGYKAYRKKHPDVQVPSNEDILDRVKELSEDVEFVGNAEIVEAEEAVLNLNEQGAELDGVLVFGAPPEELISIGLPMVAVARPLEGCTTVPFSAYKDDRVLTSILPAHHDKDPEIYSLRIEDIARKVGLIATVAKMKQLSVLVVTDKPVLGYFEPMQIQIETTREEYEEVYLRNAREILGAQFVTVPQEEFLSSIGSAGAEEEARQVAQKWMAEAVTMRGTNEAEILKSAKLYLAMKQSMEEHDCGAITTEGFGWPPLGYDAGPSQGLPTSQLCTEGIVATSETLTDCLITQQLGFYISGSAGFMGDYTIDPFSGTAIIAHCEGTFRPYRDERRAPYLIRNLPFVEEYTGGACVQINYPIGKTVTVAKVGTYGKKLSLFTGETVSGEELYQYWDDVLGRTKIAIKTDAEALLENVDWKTFGNHRAVFFGDYRREFKDFAKLVGLQVVEKDIT